MIKTDVFGMVSRMQHFSLGDGPGIRSTIFLLGCNLRCEWCHNPETISPYPVLLYYRQRCSGCKDCASVCKAGAHIFQGQEPVFDRSLCIACGKCAECCQTNALEMSGSKRSADDVMKFIEEDQPFYDDSGGGVTISGGEPLLQPDFCAAIAQACQEQNIPVIIDTAGNVSYSAFQKVLPFTEVFYFDLKCASDEEYRKKTSGSLTLTAENMSRLVSDGANVVARIPIIPGLSDTTAYCEKLADVLQTTGVQEVNLLAFHRLGSGKYHALDKEYLYEALPSPTSKKMGELISIFIDRFIAKIDG